MERIANGGDERTEDLEIQIQEAVLKMKPTPSTRVWAASDGVVRLVRRVVESEDEHINKLCVPARVN